jgi:tetratricopeptide (TPR) repeat protein
MHRELAERHYNEADRLLQRGEPALALAELEQAIEADPDCPNAHNRAGWILCSELHAEPGALERALRHFEEAHRRFPDDPVALVNLADARLASGQVDRAVAVAEAALERATTASHAHNWLGYYHLTQLRDLDRALAHLDEATKLGGLFGPAHQNRGLALEARGDLPAAYEAYRTALDAGDAHDVPFVYARMAAIQREWGRRRRALSLFRRALYHERSRAGAREGEIAAAARALSEELGARGAYFPHEREEQAWIEAEVADGRAALGLSAREGVRSFRAFHELAASALAALGRDPRGEAAAAVVRRMLDVARDRALPADLAGASFAIDPSPLSAEARAAVTPVAAEWPRLHLSLYTRLLEREEPELAVERLDDKLAKVRDGA